MIDDGRKVISCTYCDSRHTTKATSICRRQQQILFCVVERKVIVYTLPPGIEKYTSPSCVSCFFLSSLKLLACNKKKSIMMNRYPMFSSTISTTWRRRQQRYRRIITNRSSSNWSRITDNKYYKNTITAIATATLVAVVGSTWHDPWHMLVTNPNNNQDQIQTNDFDIMTSLSSSSSSSTKPTTTTGPIVACSAFSPPLSSKTKTQKKNDKEELFEGQCLKRQLHQPNIPYPAWDYNWDGNMTNETTLESIKKGIHQTSGSSHKTRHIILIRHGQYDERYKEDTKRILTPLGRLQAERTGQRLAQLIKGGDFTKYDVPKRKDTVYTSNSSKRKKQKKTWQEQQCEEEEDIGQIQKEFGGPCKVKAIYVSNMARAKETADIIAKQLQMNVETPDPLLNEALPSPMIPIRPDIPKATEEIDANHDRIEEAFQKYIYRATNNDDDEEEEIRDEFEIIVCHGNVIRYMFCRALQLPPEAWLRFSTMNCSLTYLVIRPNTGYVSARMLGDIGHLHYDESTFSGYYGFKW